MTKRADLATIHGMTVDDAKAALATLKPDELRHLRSLETAEGDAKARSTMIEAIDAALAAAGEPFAPEGDGTSKPPEDESTPDHGAQIADLQGQLQREQAEHQATREKLEAVSDQRDARDGKIEVLEQQLAIAQAALNGDTPPAAPVEPKRAAVRSALAGATRIGFAEADGKPIKALSPVDADPRDFGMQSGRAVFNRKLTFGAEQAKADIACAVLLDADEVVGKCPIHPPLNVGGGRAVELPAGHLAFADA